MSPILTHVRGSMSSPLVQLLHELNLVKSGSINILRLTQDDHHSKSGGIAGPICTKLTCVYLDVENDVPCMWEPGAIMEHILETYDTKFQMHPPPPNSLSLPTEAVGAFFHSTCRPNYLKLKEYITVIVHPHISRMLSEYSKQTHEMKEENYDFIKELKFLRESIVPTLRRDGLRESSFILGENISALDILLCKSLRDLETMGLLSEFPDLMALLDKVSNRPTYRAAYRD